MPDARSKRVTFRVTFEASDRVDRTHAERYRSDPPWVEFLVKEGEGLNVTERVVAKLDGRLTARISTIG